MSVVQEYEAKDRILRYLLAKRENDPEHSPIASSTVAAEALPGVAKEVVYFLINKIISNTDPLVEFHPRSLDISNDYWVALKATVVTDSFINNQGGYTRVFQQQSASEIQDESDRLLERQVRIDTLQINKKNKFFMKINVIFLILNALALLASLFISLRK